LENFWVTAGDPAEGQRWIEGLLALTTPPPLPHALALRCLGNVAIVQGRISAGIQLYEQSLSEFRALGDDLRSAIGLHRIASNVAHGGDLARARLLNGESLAFLQKVGFKK
ncbi:MAG: tetratricopeptide repeat protein, partial [Candidatus Limnocylindria bacterium]